MSQNNGAKSTRKVHPEQEDKEEGRKEWNIGLYWLFILGTLSVGAQQILGFHLMESKPIILGVFSGYFIIVFVLIGCVGCKNVGQFCKLYFLIDNMFVALLTAAVGMIGLVLAHGGGPAIIYILVTLALIDYFIFPGTYRIVMLRMKWKSWQVIIAKLSLVLLCIGYMVMVAQIIISDGQSQSIKQFAFVYVFGLFTLVLEIFSKLTDLDGTAELQYHYQISEKGKQAEQNERLRENFKTNETNENMNIEVIHENNLTQENIQR